MIDLTRRRVLAALSAAAVGACASPDEFLASAPAASAAPPDEETKRLRTLVKLRLPDALYPADVLERTQFSGIWAVRNAKALPRYFDEKLEWCINMPNPVGLQGLPRAMRKDALQQRKKAMVREIKLSEWPLIKGTTKPVAIVYAAWDCPYCRQMEADLRQAGISYYLIPTGLNRQSAAVSKALYGSPGFQDAWHDLTTTGRTSERASTAQPYPDSHASDIAFLFMLPGKPTPLTPLMIFLDGQVLEGWEAKVFMPVLERYVAAEAFFDVA
ncbi:MULTISPECIES: thioredoxin fold domain-containing protein [Cupriavidus]